jgi:exo-beta-1,3-glucanase (GH17 family)
VLREFDSPQGLAVAYGPHRDGQFPGGPSPTREQLREDLHLMSEHWGMIRVYSSVGSAETILEIIRKDGLAMSVMLGVWIAPEERLGPEGELIERSPDAREANRREVDAAVRLATVYPDIVAAVCVGNETQVFWSAHRSPIDKLIDYVKEVRTRTRVPVAVADDFNFWNKPESDAVAREVDFIVMHAHPLWNGVLLDAAVEWTRERVQEIRDIHPSRPVVLGETGWATRRHTEGEQARLMRGRTGEEEQRVFYNAVREWSRREGVTVFFFEAFDENWKGGEHPDEVEKHWGLYRADRTPKKAMTDAGE